jgi:hypothetical protein
MKYTLKRTYQRDKTIGEIELSDCSKITTIELPWNDNKIGESCIPEGEYLVKRDKYGKHTWFKIVDVEGRSFIEIHEGYKPSHSQGCILLDVVELQNLLLDTKGKDFRLIITS